MKQALDALEWEADGWQDVPPITSNAITALRAAIEQAQEPVAFNHDIGGDRFKVVRGAFWWHVLIGDSPTEHGKFLSRARAENMAADLLREFRNGAFVQHTAPRQWQGLTDKELAEFSDLKLGAYDLCLEVEAKLREKNT